VTILPGVSSLQALRGLAQASVAPRPMIGFGNPLLDGRPDVADDVERANRARAYERCPVPSRQEVAATATGGVARIARAGALADPAHVKVQLPLPETAEELCAVADYLRAETGDIRLGAQATESEVKRLSDSGELLQYRMLHFATHGAMAGQINGTFEPGLILTPPETASEADDGYLTASEVERLKLDADWVILSACNTAAGNEPNAEALSGLADAFIYAGARALLVSHWAVASDATVTLIMKAVGETRAGEVGRAEALRRSMLGLIDQGGTEAHPSYWAPFVVVGEGAARR